MNKVLKEWFESILYALTALAVLYFLCWPYRVDGDSMLHALAPGDRIVVSRLLVYTNNLKAGDIVVCKVNSGGEIETVVKRLIGLPGDHIVISGRKVFVNDMEIVEPYLGDNTTSGQVDIILGPDEYYILGDNRRASTDSRDAGAVLRENMIGKAIARWYPFDNMTIY